MADDDHLAAQSQKKSTALQIGLNVIVQIGIVLVLAAMVNYLGFEHYRRWDLSRDKKYAALGQDEALPREHEGQGADHGFLRLATTRLRATCRIC